MQRLRAFHRYLSLALAALWLVQVLSGVLLVFRWELDDATVPGPAGPVQIVALAQRLDALQHRFPLAPVQAYASGGAAGRFDVLVTPKVGRLDDLRVDGRGDILRWRPWNYDYGHVGVLTFTAWLHDTLFAGALGEYVLGFSGLLLASNLMLALKLAWPLGRRWRAALLPRAAPHPAARLYAWHRALGLWTAAAALVVVTSGAATAFDLQLRSWLHAEHATPKPVVASAPTTALLAPVSTAQALQIGWGLHPSASLYSLVLPSSAQPWYRIGLRQPGEAARFAGATAVYVDPRTGRVRLDDDALRVSARTRALDAVYAIHTGEILGLAGRGVVLACGVSLGALMIFGVTLWAIRRRLRAPRRRRSRVALSA